MGSLPRLMGRLHRVFKKDPDFVPAVQVTATVPEVTFTLANGTLTFSAPEARLDGPNLVQNPSFETVPTTWAAPEPWVARWPGMPEPPVVSLVVFPFDVDTTSIPAYAANVGPALCAHDYPSAYAADGPAQLKPAVAGGGKFGNCLDLTEDFDTPNNYGIAPQAIYLPREIWGSATDSFSISLWTTGPGARTGAGRYWDAKTLLHTYSDPPGAAELLISAEGTDASGTTRWYVKSRTAGVGVVGYLTIENPCVFDGTLKNVVYVQTKTPGSGRHNVEIWVDGVLHGYTDDVEVADASLFDDYPILGASRSDAHTMYGATLYGNAGGDYWNKISGGQRDVSLIDDLAFVHRVLSLEEIAAVSAGTAPVTEVLA